MPVLGRFRGWHGQQWRACSPRRGVLLLGSMQRARCEHLGAEHPSVLDG